MKDQVFIKKGSEKGFACSNCGKFVPFSEFIGTKNRNHCPYCLWSKHLDLEQPGDRKSGCLGKMEPLGLTFKKEGVDKYGKERQGELMLVHRCLACGKVSINRIAADDDPQLILDVLEKSKKLAKEIVEDLKRGEIALLAEKDKKEVLVRLFGKN